MECAPCLGDGRGQRCAIRCLRVCLYMCRFTCISYYGRVYSHLAAANLGVSHYTCRVVGVEEDWVDMPTSGKWFRYGSCSHFYAFKKR